MKRILVFPCIALLSACLPSQEANQIIVDGEATIERDPEQFSITAAIRARTGSQSDALAEIAATLASIRQDLPRLEGLAQLTIDASEAVLQPIQDPECVEKRRYRQEELCPVSGHFGEIDLTVKGAPAERSGYVLSLLSELGAESVSLSGYALTDHDSARKEAIDAAVQDARLKAKTIAAASNATLIGPIRIQYGEGFSDPRAYGFAQERVSADVISVTATRTVRPETALALEPQPITISEKVVAAFAIE